MPMHFAVATIAADEPHVGASLPPTMPPALTYYYYRLRRRNVIFRIARFLAQPACLTEAADAFDLRAITITSHEIVTI